MILINLLPINYTTKSTNIFQRKFIYAVIIIFILFLAGASIFIKNKTQNLKKNIRNAEKQIEIYKKEADKLDKLRGKLQVLEKQIKIIKLLNARGKDSLILVNKITEIIIPEKMWLTNLKTYDDKVLIQGMSFDDKTVADFMTKLENLAFLKTVNLNTLKMEEIDNIQIKKFEILCSKKTHEKKQDKK
ncbi:MAG: hypothetical protein B6I26_07060 [Desulfobacteraceae bacterium 4572_130]|nr:MAG: hypothetical protein B6I26_07060 [Desulfobacteraceae bacterium 4572_130]